MNSNTAVHFGVSYEEMYKDPTDMNILVGVKVRWESWLYDMPGDGI